MEIERKFLVKKLPENLDDYPCRQIDQGYLCIYPAIRVRREDDTCYLTYKAGERMDHQEANLPLTSEAYEHLRPKCDGIYIEKKRYRIPFGKYTIELDIFEQDTAPLIHAEDEFHTVDEAEAFTPPDWFGEDVTDQDRYHNNYISKYGYSPESV